MKKMKVTLLNHTSNAVELMIFTKGTRLKMSPEGLEDIKMWAEEKKMQELEYMSNTIPSSWEFVDYTFMIEAVTRAYTHQQVRTRSASFAQQTMRVLDVSEGNGWDYLTGPSIEENPALAIVYDDGMQGIADIYKFLIANGVKIEDARGILPTNILTNIVMKINMRNFVDLIYKRSSPRVQGEYRDVLEAMKSAVLEVHPWMHLFIDRTFDRAAADLDEKISNFNPLDFVTHNVMGNVVIDKLKLTAFKTDIIKLVDQMRAKQ